MQTIDSDRPVSDENQDEFGFAEIVQKLAPSIAALASGDSVVFGIEGPWGSGKTSFLNFLKPALSKVEGINVITLAPWLIGDGRSLVGSLISAMVPIIEGSEAKDGSWRHRWRRAVKTVDLLRSYGVKTGRGIAPIAKLAGLIIPGAAALGEVIDVGSAALNSKVQGQSETEIKAEIASRISALNARFIVLVDDLDRLEPAQAVEVIRLVRSVADFPNMVLIAVEN